MEIRRKNEGKIIFLPPRNRRIYDFRIRPRKTGQKKSSRSGVFQGHPLLLSLLDTAKIRR